MSAAASKASPARDTSGALQEEFTAVLQKAELRRVIGKDPGDSVTVHLQERLG